MSTILPNEEQLLAYNGSKLVLTNLRIQIADRSRGDVNFFLENIRSVRAQHKGYSLLLIPGCIALLTGAIMFGTSSRNQFQIAIIAGVIMLLFWWATRRSIITVASDKGIISDVDVDVMSQEEINSVIEDIETAKANRLKELNEKNVVLLKKQAVTA